MNKKAMINLIVDVANQLDNYGLKKEAQEANGVADGMVDNILIEQMIKIENKLREIVYIKYRTLLNAGSKDEVKGPLRSIQSEIDSLYDKAMEIYTAFKYPHNESVVEESVPDDIEEIWKRIRHIMDKYQQLTTIIFQKFGF